MGSTGGTLHGEWFADSVQTSSDRRLKKDIQPLYRAIAESSEDAVQKLALPSDATPGEKRTGVVDWVLRELRPVSYSFKKTAEAKQPSRYGFVAQELERVLPSLVRGKGVEEKAVVYQDFVALLTLSAQSIQERVNTNRGKVKSLEEWLESLDAKLDRHSSDDDEDDADTVHI